MNELPNYSIKKWPPEKVLTFLQGLQVTEDKLDFELLTAHNAYMTWFLQESSQSCVHPIPKAELVNLLECTLTRASRVQLQLQTISCQDVWAQRLTTLMFHCLRTCNRETCVALSLLCLLHSVVLSRCQSILIGIDLIEEVTKCLQSVMKAQNRSQVPDSRTQRERLPTTVNSGLDHHSFSQVLQLAAFLQTNLYLGICDLDKSYDVLKSIDLASYKADSDIMIPYLLYLKGYILQKKGNFDHAREVFEQLEVRSDLAKDLVPRIWNTMACCLADKGKPHCAIQLFKEALKQDFSCHVAMYNISLQYRKLQIYDAELEVVNLLVAVLEKEGRERKPTPAIRGPSDGLHLHPQLTLLYLDLTMPREEITPAMALNLLASRCYQLNRYSIAADKYLRLLAVLKEGRCKRSGQGPGVALKVPPVQELCQQAAFALLLSGRDEECLSLCEELIKKGTRTHCSHHGSGSSVMAVEDNNTDVCRVCRRHPCVSLSLWSSRVSASSAGTLIHARSEHGGAKLDMRDDPNIAVTETSQAKCGRKRPRSEQDPEISMQSLEEESTEHGGCPYQDVFVNVHAALYRAAALTHLDKPDSAMETLQRLISELEDSGLQSEPPGPGTSAFGQPEGPPKAKKQRVDEDRREKTPSSSCPTVLLLAKAYCHRGLLCWKTAQLKDAVHFSRLAVQLHPASPELLYNHCFLLEESGQANKAATAWLDYRGISRQMEQFQIDILIKNRLSALSEASESVRVVWPVTMEMTHDTRLHMDVQCLRTLQKSTLGACQWKRR